MNKRKIFMKKDSKLIGSKSQIFEDKKDKDVKSNAGDQPTLTNFTGGVDNVSTFCPTNHPTMIERIMSNTKTGSPQA